MRNFSKAVLITTVILSFSTMAQSQVEQLIAGGLTTLTVDQIGSEIAKDVNSVVHELEQSGSQLSFNVRTDLIVAAENVSRLVAEERNKTFEQLSELQQSTLKNTLQAIAEAKKGTDDALMKSQQLISQASVELTRIPGINKSPMVTGYSPSLIVSDRDKYRISVKGSKLGGKITQLNIRGAECGLSKQDETNLSFNCTGDVFKVDTPSYLEGSLLVTSSSRRFLFGPQRKARYAFSVGVLPQLLGNYELKVTHDVTKETRVKRNGANGHRNDHCSSNKSKYWTYNPAKGCEIDVSSVKARATSKSSNSTYSGINNLSSSGFRVGGVVRNRGKCLWPSKDARGTLKVAATWQDVCKQTETSTNDVESGQVFWGKDMIFQLGSYVENPKGFSLSIEDIYGRKRVIDGAETNDWFSASYDVATQTVVVKPREPKGFFPN